MTYIPDCRTDECYNQKYLRESDKHFVAGYDCCVDYIEPFFANLDIYQNELDIAGEDLNMATYFCNHEEVAEKFMLCLKDWFENHRDEVITSFIDDMTEDEYEESKRRVDSEE